MQTVPRIGEVETLYQLHRKDDFRTLCADLALPSPQLYNSVAEAVVRKSHYCEARHAFSGRLVTLLNRTRLRLVCASVRQSHSLQVKRLGRYACNLQSYSAFCMMAGRSSIFSGGILLMNPYVVDTSYVLDDNPWEEPLINDVENAAENGIKSGLMHLQYIANEDYIGY